MSSNSWLAMDVASAPMLRAQELRFAWERFVEELARPGEDDEEDPAIREPIADSWRRSYAAGVDPTAGKLAPIVADEEETSLLWGEHPLASVAPLIHECLAATAEEAGYLVVVSDANGMLLFIEGDPRVRMRAAADMNFAEGSLWSEGGAGTNAIGTALAANHAVQVFGPEHFNESVQRWTCSAAPIHDPDTGDLIGVIDLTGDFSTVHPHSLAVATVTAHAVESALLVRLQEADSRLWARYGKHAEPTSVRALVAPSGRPISPVPPGWGDAGRFAIPPGGGELTLPSGLRAIAEPLGPAAEAFVVRSVELSTNSASRPLLKLHLLGRERPVLEIAGRRTELRPRLAEILALLCAYPAGLSAEELCADLHGDGGHPSSIRVEVSRLRKLIGPWIDTDRYRLTCDAETDVRKIEGLLRAGSVREAAEAYPGPLLPDSQAPGIERERERLDAWLHQAVMTSGGVEALWAWVNSPTGSDDLGAWKRLLTQLEFRDPRRSLCAARVGELRRALA